uniref:G-patch domain-containing protein n=1 Tax=Chenopodium quinoa TaxID=63459 RepID=A0A803MCZ7_CHEQI
MLGGLYGDLPPPSSTTEDEKPANPSASAVWSSSAKMAPPTLRKPAFTTPPSIMRSQAIISKPKPVKTLASVPAEDPPSEALQPALVGVTSSVVEDKVGISGEEAWRRRAAMSSSGGGGSHGGQPPRSPSPPGGSVDGFAIGKSDTVGLGVGAGGQMTAAQRMMAKMGWKQGQGLGKLEQGITTPLMAKKTDRRAGSSNDPSRDGRWLALIMVNAWTCWSKKFSGCLHAWLKKSPPQWRLSKKISPPRSRLGRRDSVQNFAPLRGNGSSNGIIHFRLSSIWTTEMEPSPWRTLNPALRPSPHNSPNTNPNTNLLTSNQNTTTLSSNPQHFHPSRTTSNNLKHTGEIRRLSEKELQQKREQGLCFRCDEKWAINHRCNRRGPSVLLMEEEVDGDDAGDLSVVETNADEFVPPPPKSISPPEVSLCSVMGLTSPKTMRVACVVNAIGDDWSRGNS